MIMIAFIALVAIAGAIFATEYAGAIVILLLVLFIVSSMSRETAETFEDIVTYVTYDKTDKCNKVDSHFNVIIKNNHEKKSIYKIKLELTFTRINKNEENYKNTYDYAWNNALSPSKKVLLCGELPHTEGVITASNLKDYNVETKVTRLVWD